MSDEDTDRFSITQPIHGRLDLIAGLGYETLSASYCITPFSTCSAVLPWDLPVNQQRVGQQGALQAPVHLIRSSGLYTLLNSV